MNILTTNKLKELTTISNALDIDALTPFIDVAETFHIKPVLSEAFYEDILIKIEDGEVTEELNTFLESYVYPSIAYYAWYEASPTLWMKTENKGIVNKFSDNSNSIDANSFKIYRQSIYDKAVMYSNRMNDYLRNNPTKFDVYAKHCNIKRKNQTGIYLGF